MSEFMRLYRERVDKALAPHRDVYGDDAPVVKMGLRLLAEAEEVEVLIQEIRVGTFEAASRKGWHPDTLQRHARAVLEGRPVPGSWAGLSVDLDVEGNYAFVLDTIPEKGVAE